MALHAKAKTEAGYRFYDLYDKISRDDILAHAYAQCRSNKGAPGIDGQGFADIEAYGVERWLAELALALRQESYRPEPIRRVFIPKANGKLRPLGISTMRDRVCMTEVDPPWWSRSGFRRRLSRCPRHARLTRRSSAVRWSNWSAPDAIPTTLLASSNPRRSRSAPGLCRPTGRRAAGKGRLTP